MAAREVGPAGRHLPRHIQYIGSYEAAYARHRILQKGLASLGVPVDEVRDRSTLPWRWVRLTSAALRAPAGSPIVVGEAGNYLTPVLWLSRIGRRELVFDTFVSMKDTFEDRGGRMLLLRGRAGRLLDRLNCAAAGAVLVDTRQMSAYFEREIGVPASKLHVVYVGAETDLFIPQPERATRPGSLNVLFFGTFIPLHGVDVILAAAADLQPHHPGIRFTIVGFGQDYSRIRALAHALDLQNVTFGRHHVPYKELPELIARADVCLGIFANRPKTMRVIPHKVYQAAASGRAVVTADTPAIREVFSPEDAILVEPGNSESLARHLIELAENPQKRQLVAERAMAIVRDEYNPVRVAGQLIDAITCSEFTA